MSLTLELPAELEATLAAEASRRGLSLQEYVVRLLATAQPWPGSVRNGADLVAYWRSEGIVGTRSDITDSQSHARTIRRQAETRLRG